MVGFEGRGLGLRARTILTNMLAMRIMIEMRQRPTASGRTRNMQATIRLGSSSWTLFTQGVRLYLRVSPMLGEEVKTAPSKTSFTLGPLGNRHSELAWEVMACMALVYDP